MADVFLTKRPEASPDYTDSNTGEDVYRIHRTYGAVEFRVPAGTPVTQQDTRWTADYRSSDPRNTLPNMKVRDGAIAIPLADLVVEIIARSEPAELAKALWNESDDVKDEFIYCLSNRYSEGGVDDADRRKFLAKVQTAIHSKALDRLADAMSAQEHEARNRAHRLDQMIEIGRLWSEMMFRLECISPEAHATILAEYPRELFGRDREYEAYKIGGAHWNESRNFWRAEALEAFPKPDDGVTA